MTWGEARPSTGESWHIWVSEAHWVMVNGVPGLKWVPLLSVEMNSQCCGLPLGKKLDKDHVHIQASVCRLILGNL